MDRLAILLLTFSSFAYMNGFDSEQSRSCPLCSQTIGEYLIHSIRSKYDYRKHYLAPLSSSPPPSRPVQSNVHRVRHFPPRRRQERTWGMRERDSAAEEMDKLEHSILKRRWIYEHDLYAKVYLSSKAVIKVVCLIFGSACRLKRVHKVPPVPYTCSIRCFSGSYIADCGVSS